METNVCEKDPVIDDWIKDGIDRWWQKGIQPGSFVMAVLANDLREAVFRASPDQLKNLRATLEYLHWHVPYEAWGSREAMKAWKAKLNTTN